MDLVEFLRARLDEDEAVAKAAAPEGEHWRPESWADSASIEVAKPHEWRVVIYDEGAPSQEESRHILRWQPARVLRDVEAKRRIVDQAGQHPDSTPAYYDGIFSALLALAAVYSDHPDYQPEWKP